ncbi:3-oxoacyl-[acyl-carrier protein] reductase [Oxalobacteraceae bacterium GrIS 1.11]
MSAEVILITGASSDIGCELIRQLVAGPASTWPMLIAHARSGVDKLEALGREITGLAERLDIVQADLGSEAELLALIDAIRTRHGFPTQIVHLAAAKLELKRVTQFDWRALASDLEIQLRSIGMILQAFLPRMVKSGRRCKVVFMLSSATLGTPPKYMTQYTVGKYAMLGYFRSLAAEYSDKAICFNAVSPSMVETQFLSNIPEKFVEMAAAAHPGKRNADVADVAPVIRFLLSPDSDYLSGANLPVTAGSVI